MPDHLRKAAQLIEAAYGKIIPEEDYSAVVWVLYEYLSDRNLAEVLSCFTRKDAVVVWNDIGRIMSIGSPSSHEIARVYVKLGKAGLQKLSENDEQAPT